VKVPTYQAQTGLAADVGARPMRVRATPEAFGAAEARAMGALAEQVGDTALELNRKQREAAELEAKIQRDLQNEQFTNEYMEVVTLAAEEAALQPPEQREAFFDSAVQSIQNKIPQRFEDPIQQQELSLSLDRYAISKRVGVRADANSGRLDALVGESAKREMTLRDEAINGDFATSTRALADLEKIYIDLEEKGLMTDEDVAKRSAQMVKDVQYEREINVVNRIKTPEEAEAFVDRIRDDQRFDPTERRRLIGAASSMVTKRTEELKAGRAKLKDDMASLRDVVSAGIEVPQEQLDAVNLELKMYGDESDARDFDDLLASNANTQIFNSTGTLAGVDGLITAAESESTAGLSPQLLGYQAQFIEDAKKYRSDMSTAFEKGDALDFLSQRGIVSVETFDFANLGESIPRRIQEMNSIAASVGVSETTGKMLFEQNVFTKQEASQFAAYLSEASPAMLVSDAQAFTELGKKYPQIWEQLAGEGRGKAGQFAMAGAIGDIPTATSVFQGQFKIDQGVPVPNKNDLYEIYKDKVSDVYELPGSFGQNDTLVFKAALAYYVENRTSPDTMIGGDVTSEFQAAIDAVTGGIGEYNEFNYQLPRGMEQDDFNNVIERLGIRSLEYMAPDGLFGYPVDRYDGENGALSVLKKSRIRSISNNLYMPVLENGSPSLYLSSGEPLTFQMTDELRNTLPSEQNLRSIFPNLQETAQRQRAKLGVDPQRRRVLTASEIYAGSITSEYMMAYRDVLKSAYLGKRRLSQAITAPIIEGISSKAEAQRAKLLAEPEE
jgi:hypothetical protein